MLAAQLCREGPKVHLNTAASPCPPVRQRGPGTRAWAPRVQAVRCPSQFEKATSLLVDSLTRGTALTSELCVAAGRIYEDTKDLTSLVGLYELAVDMKLAVDIEFYRQLVSTMIAAGSVRMSLPFRRRCELEPCAQEARAAEMFLEVQKSGASVEVSPEMALGLQRGFIEMDSHEESLRMYRIAAPLGTEADRMAMMSLAKLGRMEEAAKIYRAKPGRLVRRRAAAATAARVWNSAYTPGHRCCVGRSFSPC
jgi:hypothetical protein